MRVLQVGQQHDDVMRVLQVGQQHDDMMRVLQVGQQHDDMMRVLQVGQQHDDMMRVLQVGQQHDAQELNQVLLDAIGQNLCGTAGESLISQLFHGKFVHEVMFAS